MMRQKELRVVAKRVGEDLKVETWRYTWEQVSNRQRAKANRTEAMLGLCWRFIGGWMESIPVEDGILLICDEEGLLKRSPQNSNGVVGNFFFVKERNGWYESLSDKDCERCREWINKDVSVQELVVQARARLAQRTTRGAAS